MAHLVERFHIENKEHARENEEHEWFHGENEWIPDTEMRQHHFDSIEDPSKSSKEILITLFKVLCMLTALIGNNSDTHQLAHIDRIKNFPMVMPNIGPHYDSQAWHTELLEEEWDVENLQLQIWTAIYLLERVEDRKRRALVIWKQSVSHLAQKVLRCEFLRRFQVIEKGHARELAGYKAQEERDSNAYEKDENGDARVGSYSGRQDDDAHAPGGHSRARA